MVVFHDADRSAVWTAAETANREAANLKTPCEKDRIGARA